MTGPRFTFKAELWQWKGKGAWHFITVPLEISQEIKAMQGAIIAFGSVRVEVQIGLTRWETSLFPSKEGVYYLPVKAAIRKKENMKKRDELEVSLSIKG